MRAKDQEGEARERGICGLAIELSARDGLLDAVASVGHAPSRLLDDGFGDVGSMDFVAGLREDLGDSAAHHAGAYDCDPHFFGAPFELAAPEGPYTRDWNMFRFHCCTFECN